MFSNGRSKQAVVISIACLGILGYLLCTVAITQTINKTNGTDIVVLSPSAMEQITAGALEGPFCNICQTVQSSSGNFCYQLYSCSPTNTCDGKTFTVKFTSKTCSGSYPYGAACQQWDVGYSRIDGNCVCSGTYCNSSGTTSGTAYDCDHNTSTYCL